MFRSSTRAAFGRLGVETEPPLGDSELRLSRRKATQCEVKRNRPAVTKPHLRLGQMTVICDPKPSPVWFRFPRGIGITLMPK